MATVRTLGDKKIDEIFVERFLGDGAALARYADEIRESGLVQHLDEEAARFWKRTEEYRQRGFAYNTGRITGRTGYGYGEGIRLYAILRELEPRYVVETGVCNGVSTAFLLLALEQNGGGELYSIDLPEYAGVDYEAGTFWAGKQGAVIPQGKEPGWMIPDRLKTGWTLILGRSQEELPPLLERLGAIDAFLHDSEHTYECMSFEFAHAFAALRARGILVADDVHANSAFHDFAREHGRDAVPIGEKMAFLVK